MKSIEWIKIQAKNPFLSSTYCMITENRWICFFIILIELIMFLVLASYEWSITKSAADSFNCVHWDVLKAIKITQLIKIITEFMENEIKIHAIDSESCTLLPYRIYGRVYLKSIQIKTIQTLMTNCSQWTKAHINDTRPGDRDKYKMYFSWLDLYECVTLENWQHCCKYIYEKPF